MPPATDRLSAAKLWLVSERQPGTDAAGLPYLSEGLYALVTIETTQVPTLAADEHWRLYLNPEWAAEQPIDVLGRHLAHQLWHLLLEHATRARAVGVDATTSGAWRAATDLALVDALTPEGVAPPELVAGALTLRLSRGAALDPGRSCEEYWAVLSRLPGPSGSASGAREGEDDGGPGDEGSATDGLARPWELPADVDAGGLTESQAALVRTSVAIAYTGHRGQRGSTPGDAARWVRHMTEPELPWEYLLAQAARRGVGWTSGHTHTTWTRPNRRASSTPGVLRPGWRRPAPVVACIVDTSGSVDDALLARAMSEVDGALRALGIAGADVTVLACDAAVHTVQRLRKASDAALVGGGGTDLRVALTAIDQLRPRPTLAVVFTDGYTPWPDQPPPGCAVVVALLLRGNEISPPVPRWATTVLCELR